ncbi:WD40-repeat-containing domain protein [Epithele typhae]|uniref:WD40-repeat-containing domain protein n=1 Tax=Epithele typhae TaxID=378194 RepID=UPI002007EC25|nr:WD40-repeat-containing domain protein [Epithele typhae]KAH9940861.1 WD40-repeat-containing domain protein [Epithele typhae]
MSDTFATAQPTPVNDQGGYKHEGSVTALVCSPDGRWIASGGDDGQIVVWDVPLNGTMIIRLTSHQGTISTLVFSTDSILLASGGQLPGSNTIIIWEVGTWEKLVHITPLATAHCLAFSPDPERSLLVAGNSNGELETWDARPDQGFAPVHCLKKNAAPITFMDFSADGTRMVTGGMERNCVVWEVATLMPPPPLPPKAPTPPVEGSPVHIAGTPPPVKEDSVEDASSPREIEPTSPPPQTPAVKTPYEPIDPARIAPVASWPVGDNGIVYAASLAPDGARIALAYEDGGVQIWDCVPKAPTRLLTVCEDRASPLDLIWTLAFSPDGLSLATGAESGAVVVLDSSSGMRRCTLDGHKCAINVVNWAPDGQHLVSAGADNTAQVWSMGDGEMVLKCNEHNDVTHTVWSPDGTTIASGSLNGEVRIRQFVARTSKATSDGLGSCANSTIDV